MSEWRPKDSAPLIEGKRYLVTLQLPTWPEPEVTIAEYHPGPMWLTDKYGWQKAEFVFYISELQPAAHVTRIERGTRFPWRLGNYSMKTGGRT